MTGRAQTSRPHWAARIEDRFNRAVAGRLRERGWQIRVEPYTGYGNPRQVRLLARAVYARPQDVGSDTLRSRPLTPAPGAEAEQAHPIHDEPMRAVRGWRSFLTAAAFDCPVVVEVGGRSFELTCDRGGYLDATVEVDQEPGWHEARLRVAHPDVAGTAEVVLPILVIADDVRIGVVSDIDDTIMVTALPRPFLAAWNAFVLHENARRVVPGMPVLYAEIEHRHPGTPVIYLSTGAWNVAPALRRFLASHGFPAGPLLLTDWGPTNTGVFRSGREHKDHNLRQLVAMFPQITWLLVGDDGQHDPEIYGSLAREHPDRVRAIALRELTPSEHVLSHGGLGVIINGSDTGSPVPRVHGLDGSVLREMLDRAGLI